MQTAGRGWGVALALCLALTSAAFGQAAEYFGVIFAPAMLTGPTVPAELKLTEIQKRRVAELMQKQQAETQARLAGMAGKSPEERARVFDEMQEEANQRAVAILDPQQQKRFREICLQVRGLPALAWPDVAAEMKLTSAQKAKLLQIGKEQLAAMHKLIKGVDPNSQALQPKLAAHEQETNTKIAAILSDEQKARWKAMLGVRFDMPRAAR